uniref:DUF5575 domain-containing protein n=1 Tax=Felis catus TaxID=9685 RepID=A0ABI7Y482_FELCA
MWRGHLDMGASRRQGLQLDVATHGVTSGRGAAAAYRRYIPGGGSHRRPRMESPPSTAGQEEQELRERAFFSWAEFSRFFDAWCQQRLALFFVKSSMHLARCRWASAPPLYTLIDVLKYSYVRLVCKDVRAPSRPTVGHRLSLAVKESATQPRVPHQEEPKPGFKIGLFPELQRRGLWLSLHALCLRPPGEVAS